MTSWSVKPRLQNRRLDNAVLNQKLRSLIERRGTALPTLLCGLVNRIGVQLPNLGQHPKEFLLPAFEMIH
jgi:hypothetical protein